MIVMYNMKNRETVERKTVEDAREVLKVWKKLGTRKDEVCITGAFEGTLLKGIFYNVDSGNGKPVPTSLQFSKTKISRSYVEISYFLGDKENELYFEFRKSLLRNYDNPVNAVKKQSVKYLHEQGIKVKDESKIYIPIKILDRLKKVSA